jgi:hypothetical protein
MIQASLPSLHLMMSVLNKLAQQGSWSIYSVRYTRVTTANAASAFSINYTTGQIWLCGVNIANFDPTKERVIFCFVAATTLYSTGMPTSRFQGITHMNEAVNITATVAGIAYGEINPGRTAINAMAAGTAVELFLGLYSY